MRIIAESWPFQNLENPLDVIQGSKITGKSYLACDDIGLFFQSYIMGDATWVMLQCNSEIFGGSFGM